MSLPRQVHQRNGRFYYVKQVDKKRAWIPLTREDEGRQALLAALDSLLAENKKTRDPVTISDLFDRFTREGLSHLALTTQRGYRRAIEARLRHAFGHIRITELTPGDVARYVSQRAKREGKSVSANRERSCLMASFAFALSEGWCEFNPVHQSPRASEKARDRYVSAQELRAAMRATNRAMRELMWAAYLLGARQGDLIALEWADLGTDALRFREGKTAKRRVITRSQALNKLLARARKRSKCECIFTNRFGRPWTQWGVQSAMRRLDVDWHFHDLRAKAATDAAHPVLGRHSKLSTYLRGEITAPTL